MLYPMTIHLSGMCTCLALIFGVTWIEWYLQINNKITWKCCCLLVTVMFCYYLCHSKIAYFYVSLMNENIFRFYVSMNDTVLFKKLQGDYHLCNKSFQYALLQIFLLVEYEILKCAFIAILQNEIQWSWTLFGIDIFQNVGMGHFSQQIDLLQDGICS